MNEIESRICVHVTEFSLLPSRVDRTNISLGDTINVLRNIVHFLRNWRNGFKQGREAVEELRVWADEPTDDPKICAVWNPDTRQIRVSVTGMDEWEAEIACDLAAEHLVVAYFNPSGEVKSDRTDDS